MKLSELPPNTVVLSGRLPMEQNRYTAQGRDLERPTAIPVPKGHQLVATSGAVVPRENPLVSTGVSTMIPTTPADGTTFSKSPIW